ncbi:Aste57867_9270 [Aphanomyces stellatus]|uniref:Aste57867_9270 protein n=1 Tax=Aphanomyces stellatus TaxID=120398 RepID=A0A485KMV9_9STRA|nr:hypothetical protein As57867_009234 [Aphanomyces stellatus]VFT86153.1 Aste57867_9270 [Aphanomyces stellatus]
MVVPPWVVVAVMVAAASGAAAPPLPPPAVCVHDELLDSVTTTSFPVGYDNHPFDSREADDDNDRHRILTGTSSSASYAPLRFVAYYDTTTLSALPASQNSFLQQYIVPAAMNYWTKALVVVPVTSNLFAAAPCTSVWGTSPPICASMSSTPAMCVEQPIPTTHFAPTRVCTTCSDNTCASDACTTFGAGNTGVPNADMVMYIRANTTTQCKANVLAYAATCQRDQYDRPTFGTINFCPNYIDTNATSGPAFDRQVMTAAHEFGHALGFSAASFPLMRLADGTPRSPRAGGTLTGSVAPNTGKCADNSTTTSSAVPSNSTVVYATQRGHSVSLLTTSTALAFARAHFNCPSLAGVEIENGDPGCLGSHWEERLYGPELMTPVIDYRNTISGLTLAYFQDTGWYQANFTAAMPLYWGNNQGCAFTTNNCINPTTPGNSTVVSLDADVYCTAATEACSADTLSRSQCSVTSSYSSALSTSYQYFPGVPTKGGTNSFGDYCPINRAYTQGDCIDAANLLVLPNYNVTPFGEIYGASSHCAMMTLTRTQMYGYSISNRYAGCYPMTCSVDSVTHVPTVFITAATGIGTKVTVSCTTKGQQVAVPGFNGALTCPDPFVLCDVARCTTCASSAMCINGQCYPTPTMTPAPTPQAITQAPTAPPTTTLGATTTVAPSPCPPSTTVCSTIAPTPEATAPVPTAQATTTFVATTSVAPPPSPPTTTGGITPTPTTTTTLPPAPCTNAPTPETTAPTSTTSVASTTQVPPPSPTATVGPTPSSTTTPASSTNTPTPEASTPTTPATTSENTTTVTPSPTTTIGATPTPTATTTLIPLSSTNASAPEPTTQAPTAPGTTTLATTTPPSPPNTTVGTAFAPTTTTVTNTLLPNLTNATANPTEPPPTNTSTPPPHASTQPSRISMSATALAVSVLVCLS